MKESMLQEIEDLQDKSEQLDKDMVHQDRQIEKLETFINSANGLNQQKVADLENELCVEDETVEHLLQVIEDLKKRADDNENILIHWDRDLIKKTEDYHDLNIKLTDKAQEVKLLAKAKK